MSEPPRDLVFISCHQNDRTWLERLGVHLSPLLRRGSLTFWSAAEVQAGGDIGAEVCQALSHACIIVLLVSADYLASVEIGNMKKLAEAQGVALLWLPVRSSAYAVTELAKIAPLCDPERPLALLRRRDAEAELVKICERITNAVSDACCGGYPAQNFQCNLDDFAKWPKEKPFLISQQRLIVRKLLIFPSVIGLFIIAWSQINRIFYPASVAGQNFEISQLAPKLPPREHHKQVKVLKSNENSENEIPTLLPEEWAQAAISIGENNFKIITETEKLSAGENFSRRVSLIDKRSNKIIAYMIYTAAQVRAWKNNTSDAVKILKKVDLEINEIENRLTNQLTPKSKKAFIPLDTKNDLSPVFDMDAAPTVGGLSAGSAARDMGTISLVTELTPQSAPLPDGGFPQNKHLPKIVPESFMRSDILNMEQPSLPEKTILKLICQEVTGNYKVCLDEVGIVSNVQVLSGIIDADNEIIEAIKKWKFRSQKGFICFVKQLKYFIDDGDGCKKKYAEADIIVKDLIGPDDWPTPTKAAIDLLRGKILRSIYKICVGTDGKVSHVSPIKSIDKAIYLEGEDKNIIQNIRQWRYKPQKIELCYLHPINYHID